MNKFKIFRLYFGSIVFMLLIAMPVYAQEYYDNPEPTYYDNPGYTYYDNAEPTYYDNPGAYFYDNPEPVYYDNPEPIYYDNAQSEYYVNEYPQSSMYDSLNYGYYDSGVYSRDVGVPYSASYPIGGSGYYPEYSYYSDYYPSSYGAPSYTMPYSISMPGYTTYAPSTYHNAQPSYAATPGYFVPAASAYTSNINIDNSIHNSSNSSAFFDSVTRLKEAKNPYLTAYAQPSSYTQPVQVTALAQPVLPKVQAQSIVSYTQPRVVSNAPVYQAVSKPVAYAPGATYVSLSQLPYTGDSMTTQFLYWISVVMFAGAAGYLLAYRLFRFV